MADLARIKENVAKMAAMKAPEEDIDGYIASEGVSIEDVRNYQPQSSHEATLGAVSSFTHGGSLGLADKVGAAAFALGAAPVYASRTGKSFAQAWKDKYNEIARDSEKARKDFAGNHP